MAAFDVRPRFALAVWCGCLTLGMLLGELAQVDAQPVPAPDAPPGKKPLPGPPPQQPLPVPLPPAGTIQSAPAQPPSSPEPLPPSAPPPVPPGSLPLPSPPAFTLSISAPKEVLVDQPFTLQIRVTNLSDQATEKQQLVIGVNMSPPNPKNIRLPLPPLAVKEVKTLTVPITPKRAGPMQAGVNIEAHREIVAFTDMIAVKFDPKLAENDLLPPAPKSSLAGNSRLPRKLAEVPEVSFEEPLAHLLKTDEALLHIARTLDKANYLNRKKTDLFMAELSKRTDLAGLSFSMGDSCRMSEERGRQFGQALVNIRRARGIGLPGNPPGLTNPPEGFGSFPRSAPDIGPFTPVPVPPASSPLPLRSAPPPAPPVNPAPATGLQSIFTDGDEPFPVLPSHPGMAVLESFRKLCDDAGKSDSLLDPASAQQIIPARVVALMQVLPMEGAQLGVGLVTYLAGISHVEATKALAKLAIFSEDEPVRQAAIEALKTRRERDYNAILLQGLSYPWPAVAKRACEAIVKLERNDLMPQLLDMLERPDPRGPQTGKVGGKKTAVVRELVKINHHRNCLLCHPPAFSDSGDDTNPLSAVKAASFALLTAQVPLPSQELPRPNSPSGGYDTSVPDILIRFDVTYLRQDFSVKLPISGADPWPEMQRFDFVVRTRTVSETEARSLREQLEPRQPGVLSPYHRAALFALREMTGLDTEPTAQAWRKLLEPK